MKTGGKFALLPTVGGQTALNLAVELADGGVLEKYGVELIGAQLGAIKMAEDRLLFKDAMSRIGLEVPKSALVNNVKDGMEFSGKIGFPVIIRPSFTLGGSGGGIAYNREELIEILTRGLDLSPVHECLIEESVLGWKEYELEVMRDLADNVIIICSIENFDPMGVHTGDSITVTPACFEPSIDYVVVKIPKWQFEKFPGTDESLGPQMKSVGEVMAIGRTFKEALMKGIRSLETGKRAGSEKIEPRILTQRLVTPHPERLQYVRYAIRQGHTVKQLAKMTGIDPWFLYQLKEINDMQLEVEKHPMESVPTQVLRDAKRMGFSDGRLAGTWRLSGKGDQEKIRHLRKKHKVQPVYKRVDTCAAEFESFTPYLYSTYEEEDEATPTGKKKVMILGSRPNRIGQGIEFDYCCCHASF